MTEPCANENQLYMVFFFNGFVGLFTNPDVMEKLIDNIQFVKKVTPSNDTVFKIPEYDKSLNLWAFQTWEKMVVIEEKPVLQANNRFGIPPLDLVLSFPFSPLISGEMRSPKSVASFVSEVTDISYRIFKQEIEEHCQKFVSDNFPHRQVSSMFSMSSATSTQTTLQSFAETIGLDILDDPDRWSIDSPHKDWAVFCSVTFSTLFSPINEDQDLVHFDLSFRLYKFQFKRTEDIVSYLCPGTPDYLYAFNATTSQRATPQHPKE